MSHIVTIKTEIRDLQSLGAACRRLGLDQPVWKTVQLFSATATGHCVQLPRWRYPVVCDTDAGTMHYDNYEGRWGDQAKLDRLVQRYAVEKAASEARKQGHSVSEQALEDGSIKLVVLLGDAS